MRTGTKLHWQQLARRLETERLTLRRFEVSDAQELFRLIEDSRRHLERWLNWPKPLTSLQRVNTWLRRLEQPDEDLPFTMGVWTHSPGRLVGAAGLRRDRDEPHDTVEISYWLGARELGRGYCTEVVRRLTQHALADLDAARVYIRVDPVNARSVRVCERAGFVERRDPAWSEPRDDDRAMAIYVRPP